MRCGQIISLYLSCIGSCCRRPWCAGISDPVDKVYVVAGLGEAGRRAGVNDPSHSRAVSPKPPSIRRARQVRPALPNT